MPLTRIGVNRAPEGNRLRFARTSLAIGVPAHKGLYGIAVSMVSILARMTSMQRGQLLVRERVRENVSMKRETTE